MFALRFTMNPIGLLPATRESSSSFQERFSSGGELGSSLVETISTQPRITADRKYMRNPLKSLLVSALLLAPGLTVAVAQDSSAFDDLNLQIHGYATQAVVYSNHNNWNTTNSTNGSAAWTEAVVNLSVRPESRLRLGVQARYSLLGDYGDKIILDWAVAEYKVNEQFGFRVGKVKTPSALFNEVQDIDPAYLWILLPQSVYPVSSRNATLADFGGVLFGSVPLGERFGKLDYRAYGGERVIPSDEGRFDAEKAAGVTLPSGLKGPSYGGSLRWRTPLPGLMFGAAEGSEAPSGPALYGPLQGTVKTYPINYPFFFAQYEHRGIMLAGEYNRIADTAQLAFPPYPAIVNSSDSRNFYVMASYKLLSKLNAGAYYSSSRDYDIPQGPARYQKDWTLSVRYDFDNFLYLKAEQHFVDGTLIGFSTSNNPGGLSETSRMSLLRLGVSF